MSSPGFFEVHITTHQQGSSEIDYRAVHRKMVAQGFERVIQTTAQIANEVPGVYRLHNARVSMPEVVEKVRAALAPLARGMTVKVMKIDQEMVFNIQPLTTISEVDAHAKSDQSPSTPPGERRQSGYPAWRRPR